jgi:hypothetical protein
MELLYNLVVAGHMLGLAALVGGWFTALVRSREEGLAAGPVMVWGARIQVLTGLALVGLAEAALDDVDVDQTKIAVKLVVALVVAALVEVSAGRGRRGAAVAPAMVSAAGALAVVNVLVATLWN